MSELTDYADRLQTVDTDNLLGSLLWYSMSEIRVPHQDAVNLMTAEGLTPLPGAPKDVDVFKRIASKVRHSKIPTGIDGITEDYRFVELKDDTTVTKRLIRDTIDNTGRKVGHDPRLDIDFDRTTSTIKVVDLSGGTLTVTDEGIADEVIKGFETWKGCLNAYSLREWLRARIYGVGATMVRPGGGVYFVRQDQKDRVEALERFGTALEQFTVQSHGKVEFHSLPLVDDRKQRDMIQKAFEAETVDAIDEIMSEITRLSKSDRKVTSDKYAALVTQYQELTAKTVDYETLLEQKLASTGVRLELFERSLKSLLPKVKVSK